MIVEMRTYTLSPGGAGPYFKLYAERGMAVQKRILGHLVGYYSVEIGDLNQVIHMWAYQDLNDRALRREALWKDAEWRAYAKEVGPMVLTQKNQILTPAPFFELPPPA